MDRAPPVGSMPTRAAMQVGDVVRMKCGGNAMVVVAISDETATCLRGDRC